MANINDDLFAQYAKKVEEESKRTNKGGGFQRTYETIEWTGLEQGQPKVIRVVGDAPDTNKTNYTAKSCTVARIVGDDGKIFKAVMPPREIDPNYILTRIIAAVKRVKYDNEGNKTYPIKDKYPEIYNLIDKNGLQKGDKRYIFERGWGGQDVLIMNVIDRSKMDWHREHKHTMLLAKSVTTSGDKEFVEEGISCYAVKGRLGHLFKSYGSWENYDIAITKTGNKDQAFILVNASNSPMEVDESVRSFISTTPGLTAEEKSWATYDIAKFYQPTSATKIYNRLKGTIARIDTALGTKFLNELEALVEKEKALREAQQADAEKEDTSETSNYTEATTADEPVVTPVVEAVPVRTRERIPSKKPGEDLPYYTEIPEKYRSSIISAVKGEGNHWDIQWMDGIELGGCPSCYTESPYECKKCPACGIDFE